jgi:hypothetical protein
VFAVAVEWSGQEIHGGRRDAIDKIRSLPPEKLAEVETFVDFLKMRDEDRLVTLAATKLSEALFRQVWDNPDDAEYDRL